MSKMVYVYFTRNTCKSFLCKSPELTMNVIERNMQETQHTQQTATRIAQNYNKETT